MTGCIVSSQLAYGIGRLFGPKLFNLPIFKWALSPSKLIRVESFYIRHGSWLYFVARFIPFGVRNVVFYSSGMSKVAYYRYFFLESLACLVWGTSIFLAFTSLSTNYETLVSHLKWVNFFVFIAFSVTVIGFICYKVKKRPAD